MKRILLLIAILLCATSAHGITLYVSKSAGNDTNTSTQAQNKATPWAHLPGMPDCTSACASYTPQPGDNFIFKGGDHWVNADLGIAWSWAGTSVSPIYIGVDKTWFTGGSWTRPILDCGGSYCTQNPGAVHAYMQVFAQWVIVDDFEWIGGFASAANSFNPCYVQLGVQNIEFENHYMHGWTRSNTAGGDDFNNICGYTGGGVTGLIGVKIHNNVVDGLDSFNAGVRTGICILGGAQYIYNNVCRYVFNGINGAADYIYGNLVEHVDYFADSGAHCNEIYSKGPIDTSLNVMRYYGNVLQNSSANGCVVFYLNDLVNCPSCVLYVWDNVVTVFSSVPVYSTGGSSPGTFFGTVFFYNNTTEVGNGGFAVGNGLGTPLQGAITTDNNHTIAATGTAGGTCDPGTGAATCTAGGHDLIQTAAQAATFYNPVSATYSFSPINASAQGVGAGANLTSLISTIGAPFGLDTMYGAGYDAVNHNVITPNRTQLARPNAAWDDGSFQCNGTCSGGSTGPTVPSSTLPISIPVIVPAPPKPVIKASAPSPVPSLTVGTTYTLPIAASGCGILGTSACSCSMPVIPKGWTVSFTNTASGCNMTASVLAGTYTANTTVAVNVQVQ